MDSITSNSQSYSGFSIPILPARQRGDVLQAAQPAAGHVRLDYCELSDMPEKISAFPSDSQTHPATCKGDMSADDIRRGILDFLEQQGGVLGGISERSLRSGFSQPQTTARTDNGTVVEVTSSSDGASQLHVTLPGGKSIVVNGVVNARLTEREDGGIVLVTEASTITYDADGNQLAVGEGGNPLAGTDGNDIIINVDGKEVDGGSGDDTIINFAANVSLRGGLGNDKIILAGQFVENISVDLGDGDDLLKAENLTVSDGSRLTINGGDGNDDIQLGTVFSPGAIVVDGGNGADRITASNIISRGENVTINGGGGDDLISLGTFNGTVRGGNGKNTIHVGTAVNSIIDGGDGTNEISVENMFQSLLLNNGEGNAVNIGRMVKSMALSVDAMNAPLWNDEEDARTKQPEPGQETEATAETGQRTEEPSRRVENILQRSMEIRRNSSIDVC